MEDIWGNDKRLLIECLRVIRSENKASSSLLQRRLRLGYVKAVWALDCLAERGIIEHRDDGKVRQILINLNSYDLNSYNEDLLERKECSEFGPNSNSTKSQDRVLIPFITIFSFVIALTVGILFYHDHLIGRQNKLAIHGSAPIPTLNSNLTALDPNITSPESRRLGEQGISAPQNSSPALSTSAGGAVNVEPVSETNTEGRSWRLYVLEMATALTLTGLYGWGVIVYYREKGRQPGFFFLSVNSFLFLGIILSICFPNVRPNETPNIRLQQAKEELKDDAQFKQELLDISKNPRELNKINENAQDGSPR